MWKEMNGKKGKYWVRITEEVPEGVQTLNYKDPDGKLWSITVKKVGGEAVEFLNFGPLRLYEGSNGLKCILEITTTKPEE